MALVRILLSGWSGVFLEDIEVDTQDQIVLTAVASLYMMVLCQGILYMVACVLVPCSFFLRRSLALGCGLVDKLGVESVDLYYEQAYDTFLHESLFNTTNKMGLVTFAIDCLDPDASRDKKRAAVRILDSFLQKHKTCNSNDTKLFSLITTSTKAVTTLISMLGWTVKEDAYIRLFAAKVMSHIAPYVQIVGIPAAMQKVSSLLDAQDQQITGDIQIQIVNGNVSNHSSFGNQVVNEPTVRGCSLIYKFFIFMMAGIHGFWQYLNNLWLIPHKESNDKASLPALGMQILEGLAHDLHNCKEIRRATELLPKIIGFISCMHGTTVAQREEISTSSLKLVAKLASVKGEIGITLGQGFYENAFLIGNLAEILELEGSSCYLEQSKLAMDIIAKIAIDKKTRQKIWTVQVIIDKLVQAFLRDDELLAPVAGEALAMLATESPGHCSNMLDKKNGLIRDLANKLQRGQHVYQAASLLQKLCENPTQLVLSHQDSRDHLSSTLTVVLGRIVDAEGKQMEALISLASQICSAGITPVPNSSANAVSFVEKLVGELKARKIPGADEFLDMRRLLVQLTLCIAESCDGYAFIFKQQGMVDVLSKVEQYMGLVSEEQGNLHDMVARAKGLIGAATSSTCPP
ncbi:hypothetical protein D1007_33293 [Hordeum vulgare]|nr:hypothetical protein D1007_33293 [Hordeum vulgare]